MPAAAAGGGQAAPAAAMMPTAFIPHGGGPLPLLGHAGHRHLTAFLRTFCDRHLPAKPSAVLVVSAHFEAPVPTLTAGERPKLLFDYHNFPPESYEITYPAPGAPDVAQTAAALLQSAGFQAKLDQEAPFDHGVFVPLKLMLPEADVPVVALSLVAGLDPETHYRIGAALRPLRRDGVFICGSGLSYHNMATFMAHRDDLPPPPGRQQQQGATTPTTTTTTTTSSWEGRPGAEFDASLRAAIAASAGQRRAALIKWRSMPAARDAHPREEHLLPLMVAAGAAHDDDDQVSGSGSGAAAKLVFNEPLLGAVTSAWVFGGGV